jgi:hypothetical protein
MKTATLALLMLLSVPIATPVEAQQSRGPGSYADPFWGIQDGLICRRWCLSDRTPCDPVRYKLADGRCEGEVRTFFGELKCRIGPGNRPLC